MGTSTEPRNGISRARSLSGSIKSLFKSSGNASHTNGSMPEPISTSNGGSRNGSPAPLSANVRDNKQVDAAANSHILEKIAATKKAELDSSRGAPVTAHMETHSQRSTSPLQSPLLHSHKQSLVVPNMTNLTLTPKNSGNVEKTSVYSTPSNSEEDVQISSNHSKSGLDLNTAVSIDAVLEKKNNNKTNTAEQDSNKEYLSVPSHIKLQERPSRSNSLKRMSSVPSRADSFSSQHKTRPHADTVSASNLGTHSHETTEAKCILQVDNFKVYDNGLHEHNLRVIPIVKNTSGPEPPDTLSKQKSIFSLSAFFKPHKGGDVATTDCSAQEATQIDNAVSLIPKIDLGINNKCLNRKITKRRNTINKETDRSSPKANGLYSLESDEDGSSSHPDSYDDDNDAYEDSIENRRVHREDAENNSDQATSDLDDSEKSSPKMVNLNAAVGEDELKLINALSERIHTGIRKKKSSKIPKNVPIDKEKYSTATFEEQYGRPVGVLGHGAYGVVKLYAVAKTEENENLKTYSNGKKLFFAVKHLKPKSTEPMEKFSTRITSEFIIGHSLSRSNKKMNRISSPNILKALDLMEIPGGGFLEVMEFCPSGDLYSLLTRKSKSGTALHPLEADCFMKQLLTGVNYMHIHGVAHCDIKPENILFLPNGLLKICDFGTSCVFQTAWEKHVHFQVGVVGSEPYVAPEEFIHGNEYDPRLVDCWSCGVVYCSMILGHYLWKIASRDKDSSYRTFYDEITTKKDFYVFEEIRHVNHEINRLRKIALYRLFQPNPQKRITVDQLLQSAWMKNTVCCVQTRHQNVINN